MGHTLQQDHRESKKTDSYRGHRGYRSRRLRGYPSGYTPELRCVRYNIVVHFLPLISPPQPPFKVISRMTTRGAMPALLDLKRARHTHTIPTYDTRWRPLAQPRLYQVKLYRLASYQIQRRVSPLAPHGLRRPRRAWPALGRATLSAHCFQAVTTTSGPTVVPCTTSMPPPILT